MLISRREKGREISTPVLGNLSNGQTRHVMNSAGAELRAAVPDIRSYPRAVTAARLMSADTLAALLK